MKRTIESQTPPENKQVLWLDVSNEVKQLKCYINGEWVVVGDDTKNNEEIVNKVLEQVDSDFKSYIKKTDADATYATIASNNNKVDKVSGKQLSTEDYTSAEKTKLKGIADGATKVIVDSELKDSTNAIQNKVVKAALDGKAANSVFSTTANGLVPKADTTAEKSTAVLTAEGKWMSSYNAAASRTKRTFLAAPTGSDGKATFRAITSEDLPEDIKVSVLDLLSYGISWKPSVADPVVTRVGNMTYHKTLPIQNNMKGCIAQMKDGVKIMYYLDASDWRWRENERGSVIKSQELIVTGDVYTLTNDIFATYQYEAQWIKINNIACQVISIDTSTSTATIKPDSAIDAGTYDVTLGAVLNGYDGEVMVLVPEFWIKSWDTDTQREVRISPSKIDDTWEHQPQILVAAYHDTILNTVPTNMGYLSTLEANSALSVCNTNSYCRGGNNSSTYDAYLTTDKFRSMLGKPRTSISRSTMRADARRSGKEVLSYLQYKRILYWLYFIEYANFNCQATFNAALTSEGYRQGGLGAGVTSVNGNYWNYYNGYSPLTPNGYTNEFGNGTNIKAMTMIMPTTSGGDPSSSTTQYVPRWHGIENPFGDIWNNVDGIIINSSSIVENGKNYSEVYATDDPSLYSDSDYSGMRVVGIELNEEGYVKEWDLGDTAEIVPRLNGGNTTQYKCDYHWVNKATGLRALFLGGSAADGGYAGLGCFRSPYGVGNAYASIGFRSSCVVA